MSTAAAKELSTVSANDSRSPGRGISSTVESLETQDIVFALVGHAGSGVTNVAKKLETELLAFNTKRITLSDLIEDVLTQTKGQQNFGSNNHERTRVLQEFGTELRKKFGRDFVAGLAIRKIAEARLSGKGPFAFILDSLKNPKELELLRSLYKSSFYLIGVTCHENLRENRLDLKYTRAEPKQVHDIKKLDESDIQEEGQRASKLLHLSDFFVCNDAESKASGFDPVANAVSRFVRLVTVRGIERPSDDERGMYAAWGASLRSACMSRQVGAAIVDKDGNVLATGINEVPKVGGGPYDTESEKPDPKRDKRRVPIGRCFLHSNCYNESTKKDIYKEVADTLADRLSSPMDADQMSNLLKYTRIGALIEFSRAVHAEMDAITTIARIGCVSTKGASLYCRTYPCHNCARHIVGAGIAEVIYIEPYPKSLATTLHEDSIVEITGIKERKEGFVNFRLFVGVAPRRYAALFEERRDLKDEGFEGSGPRNKDCLHVLSHTDLEKEIVAQVDHLCTSGIGGSP